MASFGALKNLYARQMQKFAVMVGAFLGFLGHTAGCLLLTMLFLSKYWIAAVIYVVFVVFYDHNVADRGGRVVGLLRRWCLWRHLAAYFPTQLVKTEDLNPSHNYIFGYHPHGIISVGAFTNFATEGTGFSQKFPGISPYVLTLNLIFWFPFLRDFFLGCGMCSVSKASIEYLCGKEGGGNAVIIVVGGAAESLDAHAGSCTLTLKDRKGFVRMAIKTGAHLVPVYSFGENELYRQASNPKGSLLRRFQERAIKWLTFAPVFFHGRGFFPYSFGFLPFRRKIVTVVGAAIPVVQNLHPTQFEVDRYHSVYVRRLKQLFNQYKGEHSEYPEATLEIA